MRRCAECGIDIDCGRTNRRKYCLPCSQTVKKEYLKEWRLKNPDKVRRIENNRKEHRKEYNRKNRERRREYNRNRIKINGETLNLNTFPTELIPIAELIRETKEELRGLKR